MQLFDSLPLHLHESRGSGVLVSQSEAPSRETNVGKCDHDETKQIDLRGSPHVGETGGKLSAVRETYLSQIA